MQLRLATLQDIDSIMNVESNSFIPEIQESREVFEERINTFPSGFLVFEDESKLKAKPQASQIVGYFCAERWEQIPASNKLFELGHSAKQTHKATGKVLYISSFAILPEFRGKNIGSNLFAQSLDFILNRTENKSIETLLLLVNEDWKSAIRIYENYGFKTVQQVTGIFPAKSGIIMKYDKKGNL